jgi:hypothetical protein
MGFVVVGFLVFVMGKTLRSKNRSQSRLRFVPKQCEPPLTPPMDRQALVSEHARLMHSSAIESNIVLKFSSLTITLTHFSWMAMLVQYKYYFAISYC